MIRQLALFGLAFLAGNVWQIQASAATYPYTYCSKDSCYLVASPQRLFFGILPESVIRVCQDPQMYAMTFDDGPTVQWDRLLPLLTELGVKATFFVNGNNLGDPAMRERVLKAHLLGHQVSNHSTNHLDFFKLDEKGIVDELDGTKKMLLEILGESPQTLTAANTVRPPFGYADTRIAGILAGHGYKTVRWNSDRYDWEMQPTDKDLYLMRFQRHLGFLATLGTSGVNTSIIDLNHDRMLPTLESLPTVVQVLREKGYRFVTLEECSR